MEGFYILAARIAPALASGLLTFGIAQDHAEVIALGLATGVVAVIEVVQRMRKGPK